MKTKELSASLWLAVVILIAVACSQLAQAQISFCRAGGDDMEWQAVQDPETGKYDIYMLKTGVPIMTGGDTAMRVRTHNGEKIGSFFVENLSTNQLTISLTGRAGTCGTLDFSFSNAPYSVDQIFMGRNDGYIAFHRLWVNGGNLGSVSVNRLFDVRINGDVTGTVSLTGGSISPPGIFIGVGPFEVSGDWLGDLLVDGTINQNMEIIGKMGTSASHIVVAVRDGIRRIEAGEINATFENYLGNGPVAYIDSIVTDTINGGSGDFNGLIHTNVLFPFTAQPPRLEFAGDMNGDIWIGTSLGADDSISVPSGGLKGQIIIGRDVTPGTADWDGEVTVNNADLSPVPFYADLPSAIGGGAVGVVPFSNHGPASTPPAETNVTLANTPGPTNPIILEHYGEVFFDEDPATEPVLVYIEPCNATGTAIPIACYTTEPHPTNPRALIVTLEEPVPNGWRIRIKPSLSTTGDYTELQNKVVNSTVSPPEVFLLGPVADYEYNITVGTCPSDLNGDGVIDADDLGILLAAFGSSATGCAYQIGDINGDGTVDADDLGIMLAAFGGPCDACSFAEAFSMMSGTPATPWIIESIGFQSVEEFMAAFINLNEQEQLNIVDLMLELLN